jgi:hypothetical protein
LHRPRPWHYAVHNLEAMVSLANLGARAGVDLWHYEAPDGRSIAKAIAWLVPFALGTTPWPAASSARMKAPGAAGLTDACMPALPAGASPCWPCRQTRRRP